MIVRLFALFLAALTLGAGQPSSAPRHMSIDELRPGMTGIGRTVFEGARVDSFAVTILGVLRNASGPRRDLILARLDGGPLAATGVIGGMSGSPVYVDGRLVGAVSYALGTFSKEPIAGLTPIGEMRALADERDAPRHAHAAAMPDWPVGPAGLAALARLGFRQARPFAEQAGQAVWEAQAVRASGVDLGDGTLLRPIATPVATTGLEPDVRALLAGALEGTGLVLAGGGSVDTATRTASSQDVRKRLEPGDAVGVDLVSGDFTVGATGTVTEVEGDRVYAFGHPFFSVGPSEFPMTRAHVYAVLSSLYSSMKIARSGEVVGTFTQDRSTALAGRLGAGPRLIPVSVALAREGRAARTFSFSVVRDQAFTPLLLYVTILNALVSYERQAGPSTFTVRGTLAVRGRTGVSFDDVFAGDNPGSAAAGYLTTPITALLANDREPLEIDRLDVEVSASERQQTATLERIWLDEVRPKAGATVPLRVSVRTYRGETSTYTVPVEIPRSARGRLTLTVTDGPRLAQAELRDLRASLPQRTVDQIVRFFNTSPRNHRLYVRLLDADGGAIVSGERLSALPPSTMAVLEADRESGSFTALRSAVIGDWEVSVGASVSGSRTITIDLEAGR